VAFLGSSGAIPPERELVIARIATAVAVVALVLVFTFRPVKRLARRLVYGRRATRYEAMAEFSDRLGDAYSTEDVLPRMAEIVRASTGADVARVWLHVGGEIRPVASSPRNAPMEPARGELPRSHGLRTFPVRDHGELLGELTVAMPAAEPLSKDGEELVTDLASQAGLVLRNVRLIEQLRNHDDGSSPRRTSGPASSSATSTTARSSSWSPCRSSWGWPSSSRPAIPRRPPLSSPS
jgi:hypothetical protein